MISYALFLAALTCVSAEGISSYPVAHHGPVGYHGPLARPVVLSDGYLADTHEVAAARHAQYVALANASARSAGYGHNYYGHRAYSNGHGNRQGVYSYEPVTGHVYGGQYGYAELYPVSYGRRYYPSGYGHFGHGHDGHGYYGYGNDGHGVYGSYYDFAGHHSTSHAHGHANPHH